MTSCAYALLERLAETHTLSLGDYRILLESCSGRSGESLRAYAAELALAARKRVYGTAVFMRGLVEISNYCKNGCFYCGIACTVETCKRYRLSPDEIFECADTGFELGFRTFVLQGGEDPWFTDARLCEVVSRLKRRHPGCAVTLSVGERSYESYERLRAAGADRYLLRHETATPEHYGLLHPPSMSYEARMRCLRDLRAAGFAVGCGFMLGSPGQTMAHLAADLKFVEGFHPEMCGIGPFIPHHATRFAHEPAGSVELTCFVLSLLRLMHPDMLLPATTALSTLDPAGREKGVLAGANVLMPNLSPVRVRSQYDLYDNKASMGEEAAEAVARLHERMAEIGYDLVIDRGDPRAMPDEGTSSAAKRPDCRVPDGRDPDFRVSDDRGSDCRGPADRVPASREKETCYE